jgi:uncharacterized Tic20 family protein
MEKQKTAKIWAVILLILTFITCGTAVWTYKKRKTDNVDEKAKYHKITIALVVSSLITGILSIYLFFRKKQTK